MKITETRIVLAVQNLSVSVAYYRDVLGLEIEFDSPGWCFLSRDAFSLMLGECPDTPPASAIGDHAYVAYFVVDDAQALFQEFTARAVSLIKSITDEPWGMREFGICTPDGHRMMFGQSLD